MHRSLSNEVVMTRRQGGVSAICSWRKSAGGQGVVEVIP